MGKSILFHYKTTITYVYNHLVYPTYQKYIFRLSSQQVTIPFSQDIDDIIQQYFVIALQRNLINTGIYV